MTSDRPYRKALPLETVERELDKFSVSQFDPACVDACLKLLGDQGNAFIDRNQQFDIYEFIEG